MAILLKVACRVIVYNHSTFCEMIYLLIYNLIKLYYYIVVEMQCIDHRELEQRSRRILDAIISVTEGLNSYAIYSAVPQICPAPS